MFNKFLLNLRIASFKGLIFMPIYYSGSPMGNITPEYTPMIIIAPADYEPNANIFLTKLIS